MPIYLAPVLETVVDGERRYGSPFANAKAAIDLRPMGSAQGWALCWTPVAETVPGAIEIGDPNGTVPASVRNAVKRELALGENLLQTTVPMVLRELLTVHGDTARNGQTRWGCLLAGKDGITRLKLGPNLWEWNAVRGTGEHQTMLARRRIGFDALKAQEAAGQISANAHRRWLWRALQKMGIPQAEYEEITRDSADTPLPPSTTVEDAFSYSPAGELYTRSGTIWDALNDDNNQGGNVDCNTAEVQPTATNTRNFSVCKSAQNLSDGDMTVSIDIITLNDPNTSGNTVNSQTRMHDDGGGKANGYCHIREHTSGGGDELYLTYCLAGNAFEFTIDSDTTAAAFNSGDTIAIDSSGSTHTGTYPGQTDLSGTHSTFDDTYLGHGFGLRKRGSSADTDVQADNYNATDGVAAGAPMPHRPLLTLNVGA